MRSKEIKDRILAAFSGAGQPPSTLREYADPELQWVDSILCARSWLSLQPADLVRLKSVLAMLPPEVYAYYLPAFLVFELESPKEADVIGEFLADDFARIGNLGAAPHLTTEQLEVVAEFFEHLASRSQGEYSQEFSGAAQSVRTYIGGSHKL